MLSAHHCLLFLLSLFPFLALCFGGEIVPEEALDLASGNTTLNIVELGIKHFPLMFFLLSHQIHILHFLFIKQFLKYKNTCKFLYFGRIFHWTLLGIDWSDVWGVGVFPTKWNSQIWLWAKEFCWHNFVFIVFLLYPSAQATALCKELVDRITVLRTHNKYWVNSRALKCDNLHDIGPVLTL